MSNANNTERVLQNPAQLSNQNGEETSLKTAPTTFDVEQYQTIVESTLNLEKKKRTVSIVPKYFEFTTSLEDVQKAAEKKKSDCRSRRGKRTVSGNEHSTNQMQGHFPGHHV